MIRGQSRASVGEQDSVRKEIRIREVKRLLSKLNPPTSLRRGVVRYGHLIQLGQQMMKLSQKKDP
jgi:hypothetical protein